ncbi:hypothetical protein QQF64_009898 [Cirrhinus molitorella]|uniref:G-protein coupled receptors family 1 profile domain-containing protein n=1 Tax=Cirrhinus molitorella TaxID=172907 RepID=A0ABR3M4V0_9TELE
MNADTKTTFTMEEFDLSADYNDSYSENYESCYGERIVCDQESSMYFDSIFIPVIYSLALVMGLVGNGLVLVIVWKKRQSMKATDIFILHLSLADILLLLTLPFWTVDAANEWIFGTPLCKLIGAVFKISFFCGIFMLSCISLDCYLSIIHAVQTSKKQMVTHCCCLMGWLFCLLFSIPDWISLKSYKDSRSQDRTECVPEYPSDSWRLATRQIYHILGFILPGLIMLFCYTCILLRLWCGSQCKQNKRDFRFTIALVLAFCIHWMPYIVTLIIDTVQTNEAINPKTSCVNATSLEVALTVTSTLACLHCCVIPVLYVGLKVSRKSFVWS